jgi:hypothetical protein
MTQIPQIKKDLLSGGLGKIRTNLWYLCHRYLCSFWYLKRGNVHASALPSPFPNMHERYPKPLTDGHRNKSNAVFFTYSRFLLNLALETSSYKRNT